MLPKIEIGSDGADSPVRRRIVTPAFCLWDLRRSSSYGQIRKSWNSSFLLLTPLVYTSLSASSQFFFLLFFFIYFSISDVCDLNLQNKQINNNWKKRQFFLFLFLLKKHVELTRGTQKMVWIFLTLFLMILMDWVNNLYFIFYSLKLCLFAVKLFINSNKTFMVDNLTCAVLKVASCIETNYLKHE